MPAQVFTSKFNRSLHMHACTAYIESMMCSVLLSLTRKLSHAGVDAFAVSDFLKAQFGQIHASLFS